MTELVATQTIDEDLGWWRRRKRRKREYKKAHAARMTFLLQDTVWGYYKSIAILKNLLLLLPACYVVSNPVVKGLYDFAWETGWSLVYLGIGAVVLGYVIPAIGIAYAMMRGRKTSIGAWIFVNITLVALGIAYLVSAIQFPVHNNHELWHYLVPNKELRDDFGRSALLGLYTGLLYKYLTWDPVKYELRGHWSDGLLEILRWPNSRQDDHKRPLKPWMVFALPWMMAALASGVFVFFYWLHSWIKSNAPAFHVWIRREVPFHVHVNAINWTETSGNHVANVLFDKWWLFFAAFLAGTFLAAIPALGVINLLQEDGAQSRIVRKKGSIKKALAWYKSAGANARAATEYFEAMEILAAERQIADYSVEDDTGLEQLKRITGFTDAELEAYSAQFSKSEIEARPSGTMIPLKLTALGSPVFFICGVIIVYIPMIRHLLFKH
jgi:hypothetical protein